MTTATIQRRTVPPECTTSAATQPRSMCFESAEASRRTTMQPKETEQKVAFPLRRVKLMTVQLHWRQQRLWPLRCASLGKTLWTGVENNFSQEGISVESAADCFSSIFEHEGKCRPNTSLLRRIWILGSRLTRPATAPEAFSTLTNLKASGTRPS